MENVLVAFVIIFLVLFGVLTLSEAFLTTQDMIRESWQEMVSRQDDQARTNLLPVEGHTASLGTLAVLTFRNAGANRLIDMAQWDAILQYYDAGNPSIYRAAWLPYIEQNPTGGQWTVEGIYMDVSEGLPEVYEPGVLNPGEEIVLYVRGTSPIGAGSAAQAVVSTASGVQTSLLFYGNLVPTLVTNAGMTIRAGQTIILDSTHLQASDGDDSAAHLVYAIATPPGQGMLSLPSSFTQADLDAGRLAYTHTGTGPDTFEFTISDGKDTIGVYSFSVSISEPPIITVNNGLTLPAGGGAAVTAAVLTADDPDDLSEDLVFSVTVPPAQGTLSLPDSFSQADINGGLLVYQHTGSGSDSFEVSVSDGEGTIGPVAVTITVQ